MPEIHAASWDWNSLPGDDPPRLDDRVAVWLFRLDSGLAQTSVDSLSASEQERAARFARAIDRHHWVASRVQLRRILGWLTGERPASVAIARDARGKPHLHRNSSARTVEFSVSHSRGFGMVAVGGTHPVGVDLEAVETQWPVVEELLDSTLAPSERDWVLTHHDPATAFARLWTRKEAVVKAMGTGLPADLRDVVVVRPADQSSNSDIHVRVQGLLVIDTVSPIGYCAALAVSPVIRGVTVFVESLVVTQ